MTNLYAVVAMTLMAGCLTLMFHPLLRFLKFSEVPAALFVACTGKVNRRRLAFILRSRREGYLEDIEGVPPWHVLAWQDLAARWNWLVCRLASARRPRPSVPGPVTAGLLAEKRLAAGRYPVADRGHVAQALQVTPGSVFVRGIGPHAAEVVITGRETGDWRDRLPAGRGPHSLGEVVASARLKDEKRWAHLEENWRDIR